MQPDAQGFDRISSLNDMLYHCLKEYGQRVAFLFQQDGTHDRSRTYAQFVRDVETLGNRFIADGYKDQTIALTGENSYHWVVVYFAVICSDNIIVPIDKDMPQRELTDLLIRTRCKLLVFSDTLQEKCTSAVKATTNAGVDGSDRDDTTVLMSMTELKRLLALETAPGKLVVSDTQKPAAIVFTSGTTGLPKGVMLSQAQMASAILMSSKVIRVHGTVCAFLPLHHIFAAIDNLLVMLYQGGTIALCPNLLEFSTAVRKYRPQIVFVVPAIVESLYKKALRGLAAATSQDAASGLIASVKEAFGGQLEYLVCGGAFLDASYVSGFERLGITILNGYGITECAGGIAINHPGQGKLGSVGIPYGNADVRIRESLESVGREGEILLRSPQIMLGYFDDELSTAEVMKDRWFSTGDIGYLDEDGFLFITGRIKNLIILNNGKNVSPEELENQIALVPGVCETVVHAKDNALVAEIYPEDATLPLASGGRGPEQLHAYFAREVDRINAANENYKRIAQVKVRTVEFPKTTSGKIKRSALDTDQDPQNKALYVEPSTEEERLLCQTFADVLYLDRVGIDDDFFASGGDSLAALELCSRVSSRFPIEATDLYENPTVRSLLRAHHSGDKPVVAAPDINQLIAGLPQIERETPPSHIFLTGMTGYLGSHILFELSKLPCKVTCLVRNIDKLKQVVRFYFPDSDLLRMPNLSFIVGDLSEPNFGLCREDHDDLVAQTDTVIHVAALVKHVGSYAEHEKVNVTGTANIIDFCTRSHAALYHTSTVYVSGFCGTNEPVTLDEHHLYIGQTVESNVYIKSKYRAEELVLDAMSHGLAGDILRIGNLTWRSDGVFQVNPNDSGFLDRMKGICHLGVYPAEWEDVPMDLTPVDDCARAFVRLVFSNQTGRIWHLVNDHYSTIRQLKTATGYPLEPVDDATFEAALHRFGADKHVAVLSLYYRMMKEGLNAGIDCTETLRFLETLGFEWSMPYFDVQSVLSFQQILHLT